MKMIDLTGRRFGYWTVLKRVPPETVNTMYPGNKGEAMWYCKCKCGEVRMILGGNLRSGRSHGCNVCSANRRYSGLELRAAEERRKRRERMDTNASER